LLYEVEPVADEVAILDEGRIVRQADTEFLRRDVKRLVMEYAAFSLVQRDLGVLDARLDGERVAITVERAESAMTLLGREGIEYRVSDLNLDEIFEAYVAGQRGEAMPIEANSQAELQPLT
jgi:hypothetical protein